MREFNGASLSSQLNSFSQPKYQVFLRGGGKLRADNRAVFLAVRKTDKIGVFLFYIYIFIGIYSSVQSSMKEE